MQSWKTASAELRRVRGAAKRILPFVSSFALSTLRICGKSRMR
jgi:hypothetical protein